MRRNNIERCRQLRKKQTDAERKLWYALRNRRLAGIKFRRQFPIGKYILDFYSTQYKLAIEADGGQHYKDQGKITDNIRTDCLAKQGIELLRFSNLDILNNIEGVCYKIQEIIKRKKEVSPSP